METINDNKKLKQELSRYKRQLKEVKQQNERLRASIGYDELQGWKPQDRIEKQYGWVFAWLHPLNTYLNNNLNKPLSTDIRNEVISIVTAIIAQLAVDGKYSVKLPFDPRPVDIAQFMEKQNRIFDRDYEPCDICGEKRITHDCHIIPRVEGGARHRDNFVTLCPLHHHLFDHFRLSESEWKILSVTIDTKMDAAKKYAYEVRLLILQEFWKQSK